MKWLAECSAEALGEALRSVAPELSGDPVTVPVPDPAVKGDPLWPRRLLCGDRLAEKCLRGLNSAILSQQCIDRLSVFVHRTIKICRFAANTDCSLVHAPGGIYRACEASPALFEFRHVAQDPTHDRRVRHDDAALGHHGGQVSIAQPIRDVPANAELNGLGLEPAASIDRVALDWPCDSCLP